MASAIPNFPLKQIPENRRLSNSTNHTYLITSCLQQNTSRRRKPISQIPGFLFSVDSTARSSRRKSEIWVFGGFSVMGSAQNGKNRYRDHLVVGSMATDAPKKRYPGEAKGFVEEMRFVAMKLHSPEQAKEGEKKSDAQPIGKWEPAIEGYLKFLVDSKLVYNTLERIVEKAAVPYYAEFRNTGLERSESLAKDLMWFRDQGYEIPEPSVPGTSYAAYLEQLSESDPQAFICHFYNIYFAHSAGGRMIGKKVAEKILNKQELEFYKWDGDLRQLLQNVRDKLNGIAENWSREEKNRCLDETEKSFKYSGELLRLIVS